MEDRGLVKAIVHPRSSILGECHDNSMNNSDLIVRTLEQAGVRWVFGIPSGPVLPLIDALRRSPVAFVLTASETSAAFMASAVGYLTGVPGVCVSTVGPGATNLTTGVGCAWLDRAPLLAITCNVATPWLKRRIQMRIDHHKLFEPLTKASLACRHGNVGAMFAQAIGIATHEPPGPVHLDLPEDVAQAAAQESRSSQTAPAALADLSREAVAAIAEALKDARRPLLITGLSFTRSATSQSLRQFVERQRIPFVTTLHGKGFLPESHPNFAGAIGRARRSDVKKFTDQADLILAVGYDPIEINYEEWVKPGTPIVHVSSEAAESGDVLNLLWNRACDLDASIARAERDSMRQAMAGRRRISTPIATHWTKRCAQPAPALRHSRPWIFCARCFPPTGSSLTMSARIHIRSPRSGAPISRELCLPPTVGRRWATACRRRLRRN